MSEAKILYSGVAAVALLVALWGYLDYREIKWKGLTNKEIIQQTKECEQAKMCVHLRKNAYGEVKAVICDVCREATNECD